MLKQNMHPVLITLRSEQWSPSKDPQPMTLITEGRLEQCKDSWVISYDESEATGMAGTKTFVTLLDDGRVRLTRQGTVPMDMVFSEGLQHISQMNTEYGAFDIAISTHKVSGEMSAAGGHIELGYSLNFSFKDRISTKLDLVVEPLTDDKSEGKDLPLN